MPNTLLDRAKRKSGNYVEFIPTWEDSFYKLSLSPNDITKLLKHDQTLFFQYSDEIILEIKVYKNQVI